MRPYGVHLLCLFLGKPYGGLRLLVEFPFFVWTVALGKILTCDNLVKRGYTKVSWCCICRCNGETMDHLLTHCNVAYVVMFFGCLGFSGYYRRRFMIYYVDGRLGTLIVCQLFGSLYPYACYGYLVGKKINTLLNMWSARQLNY